MNPEAGEIDVDSLCSNGEGRLVGSEIYHHDMLGSTMDEGRQLAEQGCPDGTVVVAEQQTAGRGRFDRTWVAGPGLDLLFSVVLRPTAAQLRYVNMAVTLAISDEVADQTQMPTTVKWPNDVKLGGRKVAGILIETATQDKSLAYAVVGIGLNVNSDPMQNPNIDRIAISMLNETGREFDRTVVLRGVLGRLDERYRAVRGGESLTGQWSAQLETLGQHVRVRWADRVYEGTANGVDEDGNLLLSQPDGSTKTVTAGEVTLQE